MQDQTLVLCRLLERVTRTTLHAWFDRIPRRGHLHPLSWDHASGPETRARILHTLGALEEAPGFPNLVVRTAPRREPSASKRQSLPRAAQMLLYDGDVAPFLETRPIPVGSRTGPVHRQDVTRQDLNQFSRVTREGPVHIFTACFQFVGW